MEARKFRLHDGRRGAALAVRVTPRASRNEITEIQPDGTVKVRLMAAPETEANAALITFLAGVLGVPENKIEIVAGARAGINCSRCWILKKTRFNRDSWLTLSKFSAANSLGLAAD